MRNGNDRIGAGLVPVMTSLNSNRVRFGPFEADLETHELWRNGVRLKLGGQPFEILALLLRRQGQMVSREELQKELWASDTFVDFNHGLNAAVNKLRETLSDSAEDPRYVETLPRRGYRFIGRIESPIEPLDDAPAPASPPQATAPPPPPVALGTAPLELTTVSAELRPPWFPTRLIRVAAAGGATAALLFWLVLSKWPVYREGFTKQVMEDAEARAKSADASRVSTLVPDPASDPAISPDGKAVAFRRTSYAPGGAGIFVTGSEGRGITQLTQHPGDCCPAWSPDSKMIAFTRIATDDYGIYVVSAKGGTPRKISHEDPRKKRGELAWTPDGKYIAFSGDSPQGGSQIFLLSVSNSEVHALTEPQGQDRDWGPAFSPDGTQMAFVRGNGAGFPEEIFVMDVAEGGARQLTNERAAIMGPPAWSEDGQNVIFSSTKEGDPALWSVPSSGGKAARMEGTGSATWHPSVARETGKMAAQKILRSSGIYRVNSEEGLEKPTKSVVTSTNGRNEGPRLSPDGKRLVFMSDRSGSLEIWVSNRDGSSATQLTYLHGCGTPRWSPDGKSIAFDSVGDGPQAIWVVSASGGIPSALVKDEYDNSVPSWSQDGKWIYFGSNRSGDDQVWRVPSTGGQPLQVTKRGGFAALESPDGATLYYAKSRYEDPELWEMPVRGGAEKPFPGAVHPWFWATWSPTNRGIFFCPREELNRSPAINFYDFQTRLTRQVSLVDRNPFWLSATFDGKEVLFNQAEQDESSIVLVKAH